MRNQQQNANEKRTSKGKDILKQHGTTLLTIEKEIIFQLDNPFPDLPFNDLPKNTTLLLAKVVI
jgi:hypothetical protein